MRPFFLITIAVLALCLQTHASVDCGDGWSCPNHYTCCNKGSGEPPGCCPYEHGLCCSGGSYCVPEGGTCLQLEPILRFKSKLYAPHFQSTT